MLSIISRTNLHCYESYAKLYAIRMKLVNQKVNDIFSTKELKVENSGPEV